MLVTLVPVDPVELGLHHYFRTTKYPMDLGTIQKRIENGGYHSADNNLTYMPFSIKKEWSPDGNQLTTGS